MTPQASGPSGNDVEGLLSCPFCGSAAKLYPAANRGGDPGVLSGMVSISCSSRGCIAYIGSHYMPVAEAIAAWNRRPLSSLQAQQVVKPVERLDRIEQEAVTEWLLLQADIEPPMDAEPACRDLCGNRVCDQIGCVIDKYRRAHDLAAPSPSTEGDTTNAG